MAEPPSTTETLEEDATELQFPKGADVITDRRGLFDEVSIICENCEMSAKEPYIECAECMDLADRPTFICITCFTKGAEFSLHKNDHSYVIVKNDFNLFHPNWQARDELRLLKSLSECGFGNWQDISYKLQEKSSEECRNHYLKYYIEKPHPELPQLQEQTSPDAFRPHPVTYEGGSDDPPRPLPGTAFCRDMAGYSAARGDFDVEYDHGAELEIQDLDCHLFDDDPKPSLGVELQMCLLDRYRRRLGERYRRKKLIRDHGLIAVSKSLMHINKYRPYFKSSIAEAFPKYYSLLNALDIDMLLEGLKCEAELKRRISELLEYRYNGITKQNGIMIYDMMKKRRETNIKERRNLVVSQRSGVDLKWDIVANKNVAPAASAIGSRRIILPLNISGMPGFENLTNKEKQIASEIRLSPEDFTKFKTVLIDESRKLNGLRLAQARTLLKIDVNKIRKIYDHILSVGLIYVPKKK